MATLVERASRYVMLVRVNGKDTHSVVSALKKHIQTLPDGLMRSLTWDRGTEMAQHAQNGWTNSLGEDQDRIRPHFKPI